MSDMEDRGSGSPRMAELRSKAEQHVRAGKGCPAMAEADARALVHELQVQQVELEMQNDELQRAQAAVQEASERYGDLFDFAPIAYFLWDHEGRILEVNLAGASLLGLDRSMVVHKRFGQFVAAEDRARFADFCHQMLLADAKQTCEVKILKDGQTVSASIEGVAAVDPQGPRKLCRAAIIDLGPQKRADKLAAVLDAQRDIADANLDYGPLLQLILGRMSGLTGAEGASLEVGEGDEMVYEAATGLAAGYVGLRLKTAQSLSGLCMTSGELMRSDDTETDPHVDREACRRIGLRSMMLIPLRYDDHSFGVLKIMSSRVAAFDSATEHTLTLMGQFLGVTIARKRTEEALRESEERFQRMTACVQDVLYSVDATSGEFNYVSPAFERLLGYNLDDVARMGGRVSFLAEVIQEDTFAEQQSFFRQLRKPGALAVDRWEAWWRCKDGTLKCIEDRFIPVYAAGRLTATYGVLRDVTARKQAESELRRLYAEQQAIFDAVPALVWFKDTKNKHIRVNRAAAEAVGKPIAEIEGRSAAEVVSDEGESYYQDDLEVIRSGQPKHGIMEQFRIASGETRWLHTNKTPLWDEHGNVSGVLAVSVDITERKRAEEELAAAKASAERAQDAAEHANRAKDHFLAVLSHELRTPLTPVVMGVSMLQDDPNLDPKVRETLEMVHRNIEMEARLIDDLLDVSRIARGKIELNRSRVELCTIIERAVDVCKSDLEARRLHFAADLGPAAPYWVEADPSRLQQVFWNLLKNAVKVTPHDGCVGIRCRPDRDHVLVEVNDSGIGIEPDALARVFNAFEQEERSITRRFGGLGLGLAISKALVEMHGGTIEAHSEGRNKGAAFRIWLPLTLPPVRPESPSRATPPPRAVRPLRILLVEDHGVTAKIMRMVLNSAGHSVDMAGDVAAALEFAGHKEFDLLMSDLGLPDGSGHDLMRQLRERGHTFPGIALSGYGQEEDIQRSREAGFAAHLTKPASRDAVVAAIAAAVAE